MKVTVNSGNPLAFISVNKNRMKHHEGNRVFLDSGTEFEIELRNPTTNVIGAKIYLNGNPISNTLIVLKPGQSCYLERYLDSKEKFKFNTYQVEDTTEAKSAISENGKVRIEFFRETVPQPASTLTWTNTGSPFWYNNGPFYTTSDIIGNNDVYFSTTLNDSNASTFTSSSNIDQSSTKKRSKEIETGRVEKGKESSQYFDSYLGNFESWYFHSVDMQIMPVSAVKADARNYCPGCRYRIRKESWKFCPKCGEEL